MSGAILFPEFILHSVFILTKLTLWQGARSGPFAPMTLTLDFKITVIFFSILPASERVLALANLWVIPLLWALLISFYHL